MYLNCFSVKENVLQHQHNIGQHVLEVQGLPEHMVNNLIMKYCFGDAGPPLCLIYLSTTPFFRQTGVIYAKNG